MTARDVARRVLGRVTRDRAWATPALDGELARAGLDERDRRLAAELVYGVLRHRARLDRALAARADLDRTPPRVLTALRVAAYQLLFLDRVPPYAAVDDAVAAARAFGGGKLAGFANAVLRKLIAGGEPALPAEARARVEIEHSLPAWIVDELAAALIGAGDAELAARAAAFAVPAPLVARSNRLRTTRDALADELRAVGIAATPIAIAPAALALDGVGEPTTCASFVAGRWTVQDVGAQRVGHVAAPHRGMRVLDACAGVGGKATHLAELADDDATIDAVDRAPTKLARCEDTARRLGLASIHRFVRDLTDPNAFAAPLEQPYDVVVLDAPCTGLGVLRRHPDAKWRLVADDVARMAAVQARLLDAVAPHVARGGALVYSVCTFTRAEGPDQIRAFAARSGLRVVAEERSWPPEADAFYIARLERS
jgi:16S rRNA (cytosine967-C5)-methyltransferase